MAQANTSFKILETKGLEQLWKAFYFPGPCLSKQDWFSSEKFWFQQQIYFPKDISHSHSISLQLLMDHSRSEHLEGNQILNLVIMPINL